MLGIDELLSTAIRHHQAVLETFTTLESPGKLDEEQNLAALTENLLLQQNAARTADQALLIAIDNSGTSHQHLPLMREYLALLRQVAQRNSSLLTRTRTHLALVGSELHELKGGKKALTGYRSSPEQRGRMLNGSY